MVNFIEFPIFDGVSGDLRAWISWLEDFFVRERFTEDEKMNLAQSLLEGEANAWFYSCRTHFAFQSWEHLVGELLIWRFGYFGDGGVFSDLELFLLWDKYDRILRKRRKRLSRTAINPQESISSPATIHETVPIDKFSTQKVDEISGEKIDASHEATLVKVLDNLEATSIQEKVTIWDTETEALIPTNTIPVINLTELRDSISATKLIQEANSTPVMDGGVSFEKEISCQAVEYIHTLELFPAKESMENAESSYAKDDSITQTQVPVSSLEPGLSFSSEIIDDSVAWPSEMVSHNRVHSQAAFECVKNKNNAHHVLDEMLLRQHKFQQRKKPSLSPKSRMFKFKNKMLQRNRSQMDPHHVMDSNIVTYISSSSRAKFGFKWKEHNSRYWGRMRQTRLHMRHKWKSKHLRAVVGLQNNPSYALDVVIKPVLECNTTAAISQLVLERSVSHDCFLGSLWEKKSVSWLGLACVLAECMMHTTTVISAKLYSLFSFEVVTEENISSGLSQTSQVWEPGGVLAEHVLVDWLVDFHDYAEIVEGIRCLVIGVCSGLQQPIDSRRASRVWERGGLDIRTAHGGLLVFPWHLMLLEFFLFFYFGRQAVLDQFTKGLEMKQKMKVLKSWRFKYKPATSSSMLPFYVNQMGASDIQENDKEMVADPVKQAVFNLITTAARFGLVSVLIWLTVWRVLYLLGTLFWSTSFKKEKFGKNWWYKFKHSLWQREWDSELLAVEVVMAATVVDVRIDDVGRSELLINWQAHDASESSWLFSMAFVQSYHAFKLEDKLVFGEGSIDTIKQSYYRRKKKFSGQQVLTDGESDVAATKVK